MRVAALAVIWLLGTACQAIQDGKSGTSATLDETGAGPHQLAGFDETILVGSASQAGQMAVIRVGEAFSKKTVGHETTALHAAGRSRGRDFYVAFADGRILKIDSETAAIERDVVVADSKIYDLELIDDRTGYIALSNSPTVKQVNLETGAVLRTVDLEPNPGPTPSSPIGARSLYHLGDRLYVLVARGSISSPTGGYLAVVSLATHVVEMRLELEAKLTDPLFPDDPPTLRKGFNPDLPFIHDKVNNQLIVQSSGKRPFNSGLNMVLDLATFELRPHELAEPLTFNGHRAISLPHRRMLELQHTSTPTASTHVVGLNFKDDGKLEYIDAPPLLDLFEEVDDLSLNQAETLAVLPNNCAAGFCSSGKGLNFVDMKTWVLLPKLKDGELGFEPAWATFARD